MGLNRGLNVKAQEGFINVSRSMKRMEPGSSQWCQATGQEAMGRNAQEIPPEHEEELYCEGD